LANGTFFTILVVVPIDLKSLPDDPEILRRMLVDVTAQLDKTNRLLRQLLEAKRATRGEQLSPDQLSLFLKELGPQQDTKPTDDDDVPPASGSGSDGGDDRPALPRGRRPMAPQLKRERVEHDLGETEKHCADCRQDLRLIGAETSERYEYVPAQFMVIEDVCKKYACDCTIKTATKPAQPIAKSAAGASLLAQVIVGKFADHLPAHRQSKIFERSGVEISDQTIGGWLRQSAELLLPLYACLKAFVLSSKVVGTDDTPVRALDRTIAGATRTARLWPYHGDAEHPGVVFDYTATRERAGPEKFLENYRGYLQADAYAAYDSFFSDPARGLVEVACWAHARRHAYKAFDTDAARMGTVLALIAKLYAVERTARKSGLHGDDLRLLRQTASAPVLNELRHYLEKMAVEVLPKSEAGKAIAYTLKNWPALMRYTEDGDLSIDNNRTERSLRGVSVGRKNWLFVGSERGGKTAAVLRSFVSTCELVKIDPFAWFQDVLSKIGEHSIQKLDQFLPHSWAAFRANVP